MSDTSQLQLFQILLKATNSKHYLDVGVYTGMSALAAALALPPDSSVVGLENEVEIVKVGRPFWKAAGVDDKINIIIGDAEMSLDDLIAQGKSSFFDFVYIDADKKSTEDYYEKSLKFVRRHGIIAVDNPGVFESDSIQPGAQRPRHGSVRRLNRKMASDDRVEISVLTVSDGVTLVFKK
ncbi:putative caffeoyl-CoA O-methyltransferase 3 [Rhipicephalus microplus]|uniref:putative caffeoyl-CoA O-methyltransferase 3 n=1 Tax=Rhipicephalus microplus TaxID=6941 RepID=UPI003F6A789E